MYAREVACATANSCQKTASVIGQNPLDTDTEGGVARYGFATLRSPKAVARASGARKPRWAFSRRYISAWILGAAAIQGEYHLPISGKHAANSVVREPRRPYLAYDGSKTSGAARGP